MAHILPFRSPSPAGEKRADAPSAGDWTNQELAGLYRVEALFVQANVRIETDRGLTDEGDPWFAFCRGPHDVFVHLARIDGRYVLDSPGLDTAIEGDSFPDIIDRFAQVVAARAPAGNVVQLRPGQRDMAARMHPAVMLAALIWSLYLATDSDGAAQAAVIKAVEAGAAEADAAESGAFPAFPNAEDAGGGDIGKDAADLAAAAGLKGPARPAARIAGADERLFGHYGAAGAAGLAASLTAIAVTYGLYSPSSLPLAKVGAGTAHIKPDMAPALVRDDAEARHRVEAPPADRDDAPASSGSAASGEAEASFTRPARPGPDIGGGAAEAGNVCVPGALLPAQLFKLPAADLAGALIAAAWATSPAEAFTGEAAASVPATETSPAAGTEEPAKPAPVEAPKKAAATETVVTAVQTAPAESMAKATREPVETAADTASKASTETAPKVLSSAAQTPSPADIPMKPTTEAPATPIAAGSFATGAITQLQLAALSDVQSLVAQAARHLGDVNGYKLGGVEVSATFDVSKLDSRATGIVLASALDDTMTDATAGDGGKTGTAADKTASGVATDDKDVSPAAGKPLTTAGDSPLDADALPAVEDEAGSLPARPGDTDADADEGAPEKTAGEAETGAPGKPQDAPVPTVPADSDADATLPVDADSETGEPETGDARTGEPEPGETDDGASTGAGADTAGQAGKPFLPPWLDTYDDAAKKFVYYFLEKSSSIEMIQINKTIIFVDTTAIDEPEDVFHAHSWSIDGEYMISTIGHRQDFADHGLI
ncbi:MAG: hypothetical protein ACOYJQ_09650 [Pseudochelatococcus sp.]|jgi:hypothetical protein|uniref:hypothetical protein n=1 Tax=Pseudochelatococcus sp. TaxID=2020869 RepID=UPI003D8E499E